MSSDTIELEEIHVVCEPNVTQSDVRPIQSSTQPVDLLKPQMITDCFGRERTPYQLHQRDKCRKLTLQIMCCLLYTTAFIASFACVLAYTPPGDKPIPTEAIISITTLVVLGSPLVFLIIGLIVFAIIACVDALI